LWTFAAATFALVDRLQVVLKQTLGAFGESPIFFVGPPLVKALAMDPLAPTLAQARGDHRFRVVFFQTNPAYLFFRFASVGIQKSLKGRGLYIQIVFVDGIVFVGISGLERSRWGWTLLEIAHIAVVLKCAVMLLPLSVAYFWFLLKCLSTLPSIA